jgi:hypothetical protein
MRSPPRSAVAVTSSTSGRLLGCCSRKSKPCSATCLERPRATPGPGLPVEHAALLRRASPRAARASTPPRSAAATRRLRSTPSGTMSATVNAVRSRSALDHGCDVHSAAFPGEQAQQVRQAARQLREAHEDGGVAAEHQLFRRGREFRSRVWADRHVEGQAHQFRSTGAGGVARLDDEALSRGDVGGAPAAPGRRRGQQPAARDSAGVPRPPA